LCEGALVFVLLRFNPFASPRSGELFFQENDMAESDNILTKLQDHVDAADHEAVERGHA
jgi:hypothetical protein